MKLLKTVLSFSISAVMMLEIAAPAMAKASASAGASVDDVISQVSNASDADALVSALSATYRANSANFVRSLNRASEQDLQDLWNKSFQGKVTYKNLAQMGVDKDLSKNFAQMSAKERFKVMYGPSTIAKLSANMKAAVEKVGLDRAKNQILQTLARYKQGVANAAVQKLPNRKLAAASDNIEAVVYFPFALLLATVLTPFYFTMSTLGIFDDYSGFRNGAGAVVELWYGVFKPYRDYYSWAN